MKNKTPTLIVYGFAIFAALFITLSGCTSSFEYKVGDRVCVAGVPGVIKSRLNYMGIIQYDVITFDNFNHANEIMYVKPELLSKTCQPKNQ